MIRGVRDEMIITKRKKLIKKKWNFFFFMELTVLSKYEDMLRPKLKKLSDTLNGDDDTLFDILAGFDSSNFFTNDLSLKDFFKKVLEKLFFCFPSKRESVLNLFLTKIKSLHLHHHQEVCLYLKVRSKGLFA